MTTKTDSNGKSNGQSSLTPQQETAAEQLALGATISETAISLEVARSSVSEWFNHNLHFKAHYAARRNELWRASSERMRSLAPTALTLVSETLNNKEAKLSDRLRAAALVLKAVGLDALILPDASEADVEHLQIQATKMAYRRKSAKENARYGV